MSRKFTVNRLEFKLVLSLMISFLIAVGVYFVLDTTGENVVDEHFNKISFFDNVRDKTMVDFRQYVMEKNLRISDFDAINRWVKSEKYVIVNIYKDNKLIYDSSKFESNIGYEENFRNQISEISALQNIEFADHTGKIYLECFFEYKYYFIISLVSILIAFLCFLAINLFFIRRKIKYIEKIDSEIKILEGGELAYEIVSKGNDELSSLAQSINEMRKSFIERLENEEKARVANSDLITAMSHDLRTPLTALVGYLDIVEYRKYKTDEELKKYIHNSREKAYQIKYLSDKLFEYFLVFNTNEEMLEKELFDGNELFEQLLDEQVFILENKKYKLELNCDRTPFLIKLNLISIRRVMDNLFSNLIKYSDREKSIKIKYSIENKVLLLEIENYITTDLEVVDSTGIGLKTCEKIIESHKGNMVIKNDKNIFNVSIRLPILSGSLD
ncbi:sensor histidine kinase [Clostridium manihotivorum]|uniref:histidine kinase n=1 Tax=Clostridium manihotivorum TaxID=2320868 RepID=A0A410DRV1_9CLOT|nr:HAMP domain-containing sensor histidine kinase [Clostridium manihotivorum]QAA31799.1 sensor histidine kinase [Clostridium manihotivorum]